MVATRMRTRTTAMRYVFIVDHLGGWRCSVHSIGCRNHYGRAPVSTVTRPTVRLLTTGKWFAPKVPADQTDKQLVRLAKPSRRLSEVCCIILGLHLKVNVLTVWIVAQPQPSLTTEYTPRERGTLTKQSSTPQPVSQSQTPLPPVTAAPGTTEKLVAEGDKESKDAGPDPNTLPPATAPPSHPSINPSAPGMFDGRSILEVDLNALADKPWRRPGSDISDWFNYGFDEISWEAYCYRRRELGDLAGMLKNNVVVRAQVHSHTATFWFDPPAQNFAGMSEDQLIALPPEVRAMVMAGATTVMAGGGGGGGGGMMPPGAGMNMNGGPMMNQMMNMGGMMNPMMEMGVGMGDMGMMQEGGGGGGGGPQGGAQGAPEGQVGMGMGVGEGFGPGGGAPGQGMMGMGMNPEFGMQVSRVIASGQSAKCIAHHCASQDPSGMGQQMYPGMEGAGTPTPIPTGPSRGVAQSQFRGRGMQQGVGMRGRGAGFAGRGRGMSLPHLRRRSC